MAIKVGGSMNELDWLSSKLRACASRPNRRACPRARPVLARLTPYSSHFLSPSSPGSKKRFMEKGATAKASLDVYLEVLRVEPVRDVIVVRLDFSRSTRPGGPPFQYQPE